MLFQIWYVISKVYCSIKFLKNSNNKDFVRLFIQAPGGLVYFLSTNITFDPCYYKDVRFIPNRDNISCDIYFIVEQTLPANTSVDLRILKKARVGKKFRPLFRSDMNLCKILEITGTNLLAILFKNLLQNGNQRLKCPIGKVCKIAKCFKNIYNVS